MYLLETQNIVKDYAGHRALDDVSLSISKGSVFGLLGPNGAGKTSLIRIINQITAPDQGKVLFNGEALQEKHIRQIGYLPEERGLYKKMKVGDQLLYLAQLKGLSERQAMDKLRVWFTKFDIKPWWEKTIADLSKGMQQKIQFVSTVLHEPELVILDEPFSGFDPINANLIRDEILELRQKGCTIIFSTHRMDSVEELCDHIALIDRSRKVLDGPKREIKERFKTHTFFVEYRGDISPLNELYRIGTIRNLPDRVDRAEIFLPATVTSNQLLQQLINQVEVHAFGENLPTMHDIFVRVVSQSDPVPEVY